MPFTNNQPWSNLHENINFTVERYYEIWNRDANNNMPHDFLPRWNCGITNIKAALADAAQNNKRVRVFGGGWSLSDVQQTTDYFLNLNPLNMIQVGMQVGYIQAAIPDPGNYCLSQCGASVMEINEQLRQSSLALSTSGASDGQSIVGAFSTGTHGAALNFGAMPDFVVALHIIVSDTLHYWIEGDTQIVTDAFVNDYTPGATRINKDAVLNSAIVSFGSFGVIHAALLKVEPIYELQRYTNYFDWSVVQNSLNGPSNLDVFKFPTDKLYNFSVLANPYNLSSMVVSVMQKVPFTGHKPPSSDPGFGPGNDVLHLIGGVSNILPGSIPSIMRAMDALIKGDNPKCNGETTNIPGWIFASGTTAARGKGLSVELGVDASGVLAAALIIFDECNNTPFPGAISFRYVKKTKTVLGFTKFPITCTVEFPAVYSDETNKFYKAMFARLDTAGITYTFHWGQCNNLDSVNIVQKYGADAINTWLNARYTVLPTHQQQLMFSNNFMHRVGLDALSPVDPFAV